ncbi:MAG: lactonase family protein [Lachnospiraceae bacterium]|nr:lactonase family protein [Lachnospiraceae bacterium]
MSKSKKYIAYAGTYTLGKSTGIHNFDVDVAAGRIIPKCETPIDNPSYIAVSYNGQFLYSISDDGVHAYKITNNGDLEYINSSTIKGMRGCHISINKANTHLFVSGYHDGKITVMSINEDGSIGYMTDEVYHKGMGSIADRNFRPHISCSALTPDEEILCVCDLGIDQVKLYQFNAELGKIKLVDVIRTQLESAPRQILFSADGRFAYVVCELKNVINVYSYNKDSKTRFELVQTIFTIRSERKKANTAAACITFSPDGEFLLCSNAGDNSVTIYKVNKETGMLLLRSSLPVSGDYPKDIVFFPDGKHFVSLNHEANTITTFTINYERALIVMNGPILKIDKPNNLVFVELK